MGFKMGLYSRFYATHWYSGTMIYLRFREIKIFQKWFAIMNSLVIVLFLSGMVAMITIRSLHKDIARYNSVESSEEAQEEFGWKLVHGKNLSISRLLAKFVIIFWPEFMSQELMSPKSVSNITFRWCFPSTKYGNAIFCSLWKWRSGLFTSSSPITGKIFSRL